MPPGFRTRSISAMAISGRGAKMCPNWLSTVELAIFERQIFHIPFMPFDLHLGEACVLPRSLEQLRSKVERSHGGAQAARQ